LGTGKGIPGGLAIVHSGLLGLPPEPVIGTAAGGRLHLFGTGESGGWHLALDRDGVPVGEAVRTGLPGVRSLAATGDALLVSCAGERDGRPVPVLARVSFDGAVTDRAELALAGPLGRWPTVATTSSTTWYAWTTRHREKENGAWWWVASQPARAGVPSWDGAGCGEQLGWSRGVKELAVAALGAAVMVAGLVGGAGRVGAGEREERAGRIVVRLAEGGREVGTGEVPDVRNPAFLRAYAGPRGWWVVWKERAEGGLLGRRLPYGAAPDAVGAWDPPLRLYRTRAPDRVHDAHLIVDGGGAVALRVRVAAAGSRRYRDLVASLLPTDGTAAGLRELSEPGTGWSAGGWLDGRLVLVHGARGPRVTVLKPVSR
jgi:hypothetical protein